MTRSIPSFMNQLLKSLFLEPPLFKPELIDSGDRQGNHIKN
jgi:hypothetical protein